MSHPPNSTIWSIDTNPANETLLYCATNLRADL